MRKTKEQKAITLIALIITIVVLLILAVVAINAVTGDEIIEHATNAKDEYKVAQDKEELMLYMTEWKMIKEEEKLLSINKGEEKSSLINYVKDKYGDSAQESEDGKVVIVTDNGNSFGITESGEVIESEEVLLTVEQLQELYTFSYYDSISLAITDVNNSTTSNANSNAENAVAGIYNKSGKKFVVLMKDTKETDGMTLRQNMTINLGGNLLIVENDDVAISGTSGNKATINIDGRLEGSGINIENDDGNAIVIQTGLSNFNINGGTYTAISDNSHARVVTNQAILNMKNCNISASSTTKAFAIYNASNGTATMTDCEIYADSPYTNNSDDTGYDACSIGVKSYGKVSLTNCNTAGTQSGVESSGYLYVDGGTHKSYGHGGLYVCGNNTEAYVQNATLIHWEYDGEYGPLINVAGHAGSYIGSGSYITVYMDNCDIYRKTRNHCS